MEERWLFQEMVLKQLDIHWQEMNRDLNLTLYVEIKPKWIADLNVKKF